MSETTRRFRVALTGDFFAPDGSTKYPDIGLSVFDGQRHIEWVKFREHKNPIEADQVAGAQGVIVLTPSVTAETVSQNRDLLAIGRFGVGYDAVDVEACTQADVVVFITAGAVDRSVAEATVGWMIALSHHFRVERHAGAHRPVGRAIAVHGPGAARPDVRRDRTGRDRPGHRGPAARVRHEDAAGV